MIKLKPLITETTNLKRSDTKNPEFLKGMQLAIQDRSSETKRSEAFMNAMPKDFVRGYKSVMDSEENTGFWTTAWPKINDKLTDLLAMMGRSYGTRR